MFEDRVINLGRLTLPEDAPACLNLERLRQAGDRPTDLLLALKFSLREADTALAEAFWAGTPIEVLVRTRAWAVEQILLAAWQRLFTADEDLALVLTHIRSSFGNAAGAITAPDVAAVRAAAGSER